MREPGASTWRKELLIITTIALLISAFCGTLSFFLLRTMPRAPNVPDWLEVLMAFGWVTGGILSLSALGLKPIIESICSERTAGRIAMAHAIQLPFVFCGVGTWVVLKVLGRL